jgi:hypothetical protein
MEQSSELKAVLLSFYEALTTGDIGFIKNITSRRDGVLMIGTDPNEWWADYETIIRVNEAQINEMGGIPVEAGDPQAYSEGDVGWVADQGKFKLPDGSEIPLRVTGVFLKENGDWKLVQIHASIGVSNEDAFGQELTQ